MGILIDGNEWNKAIPGIIVFLYGAVINGLKTKQNITLLNSVQRLANILILGALPSLPGNALIIINYIIPFEN